MVAEDFIAISALAAFVITESVTILSLRPRKLIRWMSRATRMATLVVTTSTLVIVIAYLVTIAAVPILSQSIGATPVLTTLGLSLLIAAVLTLISSSHTFYEILLRYLNA